MVGFRISSSQFRCHERATINGVHLSELRHCGLHQTVGLGFTGREREREREREDLTCWSLPQLNRHPYRSKADQKQMPNEFISEFKTKHNKRNKTFSEKQKPDCSES